jgi:hypothetical protein
VISRAESFGRVSNNGEEYGHAGTVSQDADRKQSYPSRRTESIPKELYQLVFCSSGSLPAPCTERSGG